jgi:Glycosyltransferase family 87
MTTKKIGQGFVVLGILGVVLSLLTDILPGANPGIQSTQILAIEISAAILLAGAWILLSATNVRFEPLKLIRGLMAQILNLPVIAWVLIGFLIVYILFFVSPLFLNHTFRMKYFITYLPDKFPIGNDLITVLDLMKGWFFEGKSPYTLQFYPPFTYIFFAPLLLVDYYPTLFMWFTMASVIFYIILTLVMPLKISGMRNLSMILLLFLPGLISYGFQFELERGQYNVFTFLLCLLGIYIFHNHPKQRLLAYVLFTISVQLKLYPAIFIVMFVDDWRDWKIVLRRFAVIGAVNFLLLFSMGGKIFSEFILSVTTQISTPGWGWNGNHSIKAFIGNLVKDGFRIVPADSLAVLQRNSSLMATLLLLIFLATYISAIVIYQLRKQRGIDTHLLLTCMIGALTIPISNDYTLSILTSPMILFLCDLPDPKNTRHKLIYIILVLGIAISYSSLLIPFKYKPYYLNNAFPALFLILIFATIQNIMQYRHAELLPATT